MKKVKVIAHRGFSGKFPENTVLAFREAVKIGSDSIEMDVKSTKDGSLVILHDETVDRTMNGKGKIIDLTLIEAEGLDAGSWLDPALKRIKIPTLEEALDSIPSDIELNLHMWPVPETVGKTIKLLKNTGRIDNSYLAVDANQHQLARKLHRRIRICNMRYQSDPEEYVEETRKLKCPILQFFSPSYKVTKELVDRAHSYGIYVNVFFADTEEEMKRLIEIKTDAILTNRPDLLIKLQDNMQP